MNVVLGNIGFLKRNQFDTFLICKIRNDYSFICMKKDNPEPVRKQIVSYLENSIDTIIMKFVSNFIKKDFNHFEFCDLYDNTFLSVGIENGKHLHLRGIVRENDHIYCMTLERYLENRRLFLEQHIKAKRIHLLGFPNSSVSNYSCVDDQCLYFQFLFKQETLASFEEKFIKKYVKELLHQNHGLLVMEEQFFFDKTKNIEAVQVYSLKKGKLQMLFDSCFLEIIQSCIVEYEKTSEKKLYKVLRGGNDEKNNNG